MEEIEQGLRLKQAIQAKQNSTDISLDIYESLMALDRLKNVIQ